MPILEVHHIEKHFGATRVLEDISFSMEEGRALAIIGSSGSGKTTLLRCLNFLETPDRGQILVRGKTLFDAADPATQRENELNSKIEATRRRAKESAAHAQSQQRELTITLKSTQAALEETQKARDEALATNQSLQLRIEQLTAQLEDAQRRAAENKFTKKLLEAVAQRRENRQDSGQTQ